MIKNRLVLIDAFALIHRAFHAIPPLTNKDGVQLNAVYGFTSALLSAIKELEPEYLAVGIDLPKPTKRHAEYAEYKIHRPPAPEELKSQIPYVYEVLKTFNIPVIGVEGYEGEDVIATVVAKIRNPKSEARNKSQILNNKNSDSFEFRDSNFEFIIVTGDLDTLQLIDETTKVYSMARGVNQAVMYDEKKVRERYGLKPSQFVDFKALKGDASDNIPGVPGIGEKGAANLIKEFGSLDILYDVIARSPSMSLGINSATKQSNLDRHAATAARDDNIKKLSKNLKISEKIIRLLQENKEQAFLSQKLSKIETNVPLEFELESARVHDYDKEKVIELFNKFGFRSLIARLPEEKRENPQQTLL